MGLKLITFLYSPCFLIGVILQKQSRRDLLIKFQSQGLRTWEYAQFFGWKKL